MRFYHFAEPHAKGESKNKTQGIDYMGKLRNIIIVLFIILLLVLAVLIYVIPGLTGMLVETYTAEYGDISIHDDTTGYFVRTEDVYSADSGGNLAKLATEGDLLRPYTTVVEISGGSSHDSESDGNDRMSQIANELGSSMKSGTGYKIEPGGIVSFFVDGYENKLTPNRLSEVKKEEVDEIEQSQVVEVGSLTSKGNPVFKIVGNNGWYIIAYVPSESRENYEEGDLVNVTFFEKDGDSNEENLDLSTKDPLFNKVDMRVREVSTEGDYTKLVLESSRYFGGIGQYRVAYCRIVSEEISGLLIDPESLVEKDGKTGVYVKQKTGRCDFIPVEVYGKTDEVVVIADTYFYDEEGEYNRSVDPFDDVLRHPESELEKDLASKNEENSEG